MKFGRYLLFELIGQGAMSKVYRAHDTVMGRDVAIKFLSADLTNERGLRDRFNREALSAARLTEPHIIPIHDTGEIEGQLYLVMPIINGINISAALKRDGPMAPARAVRVIEQIAAALHAAHAAGLVHRDVKPSNALMTDDDFVYLIDFGLVHDRTATELTTAGQILGTYAYMAPECLMTPGVADARADVYALACVLYECLTGERPYPGDLVAQQMTAHLTLDPPQPSLRQPAVPAGFDDVLARGMAKKLEQRYQSATDLAVAARAALTTPLRARTAGSEHREQIAAPPGQIIESPSPVPTPQMEPKWSTNVSASNGTESIRPRRIGTASFPWPPPSQPDRPPYRGWAPFQPIDAGVFFGRDAELVRAMDALREMRHSDKTLFVLLGASGAGKSCFLRAGIVPRLQRDEHNYLVLDIVRPELKALTGPSGLAQAICATRQRFGFSHPPLGDIKDACTRVDVERLRTWLIECRDAATGQLFGSDTHDESPTIVLPLDQAEELFPVGGAEAAGFLSLVHALALGADGQQRLPLIVVATIRTDRYELMQIEPQLAELQTEQFDLRPMDLTQFNSVIVGPAQRSTDGGRPLYIEEQLVSRLLADASGGADTLPLLSLTLAWLYRDYGSTGRLTLTPYTERGGIASVVQAEIDTLLSAHPDERDKQLKLLRTAFIPWLATINPDNDQPMRRLTNWEDLPEDARPLLERLVTRRLLIKDRRDGVVVAEVALESLLRQWDDLASWLAEEREDLKAADALERGAAEWGKKGCDEAWLLHGTRLADAENLAAKPGFRDRLDPTRDYLLASRQRENERADLERQRQQAELEVARKLAAAETQPRQQSQESAAILRKRSRILRTVLVGTVVVAIIAVVGAATAVVMFERANRAARDALAAELDAEAAAMFANIVADSDIRAVTATLAAQRVRSDPAASRGALYTATAALNTTRLIVPAEAPVSSVVFSPDGHTLASGSADHTVRLWDVTDPAYPRSLGQPLLGHTADVASVVFSPDGRTLASGSNDATVRLWNLDTALPLQGHTTDVGSVVFSPDGHTLASGSADHTVRLWDVKDPVHSRSLGQPLRGHTADVGSVVFSPDGHTLASGSADHTVRLWDLTDREHPRPLGQPLHSYDRGVLGVAFSPDGHTLASGTADGTVRLWDLTDREHPRPLGQPLQGHTADVTSVAFSPDGHTLASGSADHTVRLWPTPVDATTRTLCSKLISNISNQNWSDWIPPSLGYMVLCPDLGSAAN